jgi:hypothetical protein
MSLEAVAIVVENIQEKIVFIMRGDKCHLSAFQRPMNACDRATLVKSSMEMGANAINIKLPKMQR